MVKVLFLGLLAATMCGCCVGAAFAPQSAHRSSSRLQASQPPPAASVRASSSFAPSPSSPPSLAPSSSASASSSRHAEAAIDDPTIRNERSTNLSHITGTARKIQMFIKNRHLQLLPDGVVNGTSDDASIYTILQRTTVGIGQLKIQGVATCQYLCMDSCGLPYGSREFVDECVFNEMIEQHHYNTYSSTKYSNSKRTLYLALNRRGQPRKVMLRATQQLGRLSSYTRVLTRSVAVERLEELHPVRHHAHLCTTPTVETATRLLSRSDTPSEMLRCRKRKKRKKKKRKCLEGEAESDLCQKRQPATVNRKIQNKLNGSNSSKKCDSEDNDECQRVDATEKNRHKTKYGDKQTLGGAKKRKKHAKGVRNKKGRVLITTSTEVPVTEEVTSEEDYAVENTTAWEWDDATATPFDDAPTPRPD